MRVVDRGTPRVGGSRHSDDSVLKGTTVKVSERCKKIRQAAHLLLEVFEDWCDDCETEEAMMSRVESDILADSGLAEEADDVAADRKQGEEGCLLLDIRDLSLLLGASDRTLWRLLKNHQLPEPIKLGGSTRWRRTDIDNWIAAGCPETGGSQETEA